MYIHKSFDANSIQLQKNNNYTYKLTALFNSLALAFIDIDMILVNECCNYEFN
jgi:hypothetical protein